MEGCNSSVTLWNKFRNKDTGKDEFVRHVLPVKCLWKAYEGREKAEGGAAIANRVTVVVPFTDEYMAFGGWVSLSGEEKNNYFTLKVGDIMALGEVETEITGEKPFTAAEVLGSLGSASMVIKGFVDAASQRNGRHFRIEGV